MIATHLLSLANIRRMLILLCGLLFIWQSLIWIFAFPPYILPSPAAVARIFSHDYQLLWQEALPTMLESILGLGIGIICGSCAAISMAFFRPLSLWLLPVLIISQAIPTFAIAPLLVIWFGYGLASKIATTVLMLFFPITSAFYDGLRHTNKGWLDLAKTMQAKKWRVFYFIRIPAALPSLATGIRLASVVAPLGAIVGEWVGASQGLGYLMLNANARMQIDVMFAALVVIIIFSLSLYFCTDWLMRKLIP